MAKKKIDMDENKIKHLEFIQGVITRLNSNSFQMKGWAITIVAAFLALYAGSTNNNPTFILVAILPTFLFWILDSYYLQQERKFRGVYSDVIGATKEKDRKEILPFSMPICEYKKGKYCYWRSFSSITIFPLYSLTILALVAFWRVVKFGCLF